MPDFVVQAGMNEERENEMKVSKYTIPKSCSGYFVKANLFKLQPKAGMQGLGKAFIPLSFLQFL